MDQTNIAELKSHLSDYLQSVQKGKTVEICKRNVPIARIVPIPEAEQNQTVLGCGKNTVTIKGDLTEPVLEGWGMLEGELE
ncbi:MAG: type II toxin-antitoxin system Phd/YefM family antitoxin [Deltaproteobacteria bacterium]|nr:type II toxin-antitoxin system Phd/YefM family antitoxin [Deltaproteobacteria bacterium]